MKGNRKLILITLVLALGAVAFWLWNGYADKQTDAQSQSSETETSWIRYENKELGFSFSYPSDMYLEDDLGDYAILAVTPLPPGDIRHASGYGIASSLRIAIIKEESVDAHIRTLADDTVYRDLTSSEIELNNGVTIPIISYIDSYTGSVAKKSFIELDDGTIISVWFLNLDDMRVDDTDAKDFKILRSFRW